MNEIRTTINLSVPANNTFKFCTRLASHASSINLVTGNAKLKSNLFTNCILVNCRMIVAIRRNKWYRDWGKFTSRITHSSFKCNCQNTFNVDRQCSGQNIKGSKWVKEKEGRRREGGSRGRERMNLKHIKVRKQ